MTIDNEPRVAAALDAITEARRFIDKANAWIERVQKDTMALYGSKEGGAVRRASLDLSAALVKLRHPQ